MLKTDEKGGIFLLKTSQNPLETGLNCQHRSPPVCFSRMCRMYNDRMAGCTTIGWPEEEGLPGFNPCFTLGFPRGYPMVIQSFTLFSNIT